MEQSDGERLIEKDILSAAARRAGVDSSGATIIRDGSNAIYRLPNNIIARIGQSGTGDMATREVKVSRWISECGLSVVQALPDIPQNIVMDDRPVTWWSELPKHRAATPAELAAVLRAFHSLPEPRDIDLPDYDPFDGLDQCVAMTSVITDDERSWFSRRLAELRRQYGEAEPRKVIHGDAWQANVAVTESGEAILLDMEKVSYGRRDWDLIHIAVDYTDFGRLTEDDYGSFVSAYGGFDVTRVEDYRTLADIQELRWACFALKKAATSDYAASEARLRLACLRGEQPRPWVWQAL